MSNIRRQFDHIFKVVSNEGFLRKEALGGEIPFFIAAYPAKQEIKVWDEIRMLKNKLSSKGIEVLEINLYDLICDILQLEYDGGIEELFALEKEIEKEYFLNAIQSIINIEDVFLPQIRDLIEESESRIYFITGVGQAFPIIRSHVVLNNLQSIAKDCPTITFFPGDYNGLTLNLFGILKDDNYYRAFNLENLQA